MMDRKFVDRITLLLGILLILALGLQWMELSKGKRVLVDDTATALFCSAEALPVSETASPFQFNDLKPGHWAYDAVKQLTAQGIIQGYPDGTFQPEAALRYGEFIKLILSSQGENPISGGLAEGDNLSRIHWALGHYYLALKEGYFTVHDIAKLQLDRPIPRGVMALLISSVLGEQTISDYNRIRGSIQDVTGTTPYEFDIVASYASGILNGYEDHTFRPSQGLTRAEGAAVIQRLVAWQEEKGTAPESTQPASKLAPIDEILDAKEVEKLVSIGPITEYRIVSDPAPYDLSVRDSRFGGQQILSIRTTEPVCFLQGDPAAGQMKVLLEMTAGRSQYPSKTGITARYFVGDLGAADYIAISPSYQFGAKEGTLTLVPNPFRAIKL